MAIQFPEKPIYKKPEKMKYKVEDGVHKPDYT